MSNAWSRVLGVGLTAALAVITLVLTVNGQLALYINPDGTWFAVAMAIIALVGCVFSFAIPLGGEDDHGHDHDHGTTGRHPVAATMSAVGGGIALAFTVLALITPPAALSAQTAMDRDIGVTPLFGGDDVIALATTGDTATFGVGDWATVFATAADTRLYEGSEVTLTGFITPSNSDDGIQLTRMVVTHCVIDAQPANVSLVSAAETPETGQWVSVTGVVVADKDGSLAIEPQSMENIAEPTDPYEY